MNLNKNLIKNHYYKTKYIKLNINQRNFMNIDNNNYSSLSNLERNEYYESISEENIILPYKDALNLFHHCVNINDRIANAWENFKANAEKKISDINENQEILFNVSLDKVDGELHFFTFNGLSKNISMVTYNISNFNFVESNNFTNPRSDMLRPIVRNREYKEVYIIPKNAEKYTIEKIWNNNMVTFYYKKSPKYLNYQHVNKRFLPMPTALTLNTYTQESPTSIDLWKRENTLLASNDLLERPKFFTKSSRKI